MESDGERGVSDRREIGVSTRRAERERAISPDGILSAVANEHRRAILHSLDSTSEGVLEYDVLVDRVADRVRGGPTERMSDERRRRVRIALYHSHLPKLEELRMIDYDTETNLVRVVGGELEHEILALAESYDAHQ